MRRPKFRFLMAAAIVAVLLLVGSAPPASAKAPTHPDLGGHLTARWWEWTLEQPATGHPFVDPQTVACSENQSGPIWFLGGSFNAGTASRTCTVDRGKWLLVPAINVDCSSLEGGMFFGATPEARRACVERFLFDDVFVTLKPRGWRHAIPLPTAYIISPNFAFVLPVANVLGVVLEEPTRGEAVSAGHWTIIPPLPRGNYTLTFGGKSTHTDDPNFAFSLTITYELTYG